MTRTKLILIASIFAIVVCGGPFWMLHYFTNYNRGIADKRTNYTGFLKMHDKPEDFGLIPVRPYFHSTDREEVLSLIKSACDPFGAMRGGSYNPKTKQGYVVNCDPGGDDPQFLNGYAFKDLVYPPEPLTHDEYVEEMRVQCFQDKGYWGSTENMYDGVTGDWVGGSGYDYQCKGGELTVTEAPRHREVHRQTIYLEPSEEH